MGSGNNRWRSFEEAREYVRGLGLKSRAEWQAYCKSGDKPDDIPSTPNRVYDSKFKGVGDWLGTGTTRPQDRQFRPFEEARDFVRNLDLKSQRDWNNYRKSGDKPDDIPSNPRGVYGSEFKGYGDWLGTGTTRPQDRQFRPFEEAQEFVRGLGLKSRAEWKAYCKSGDKPDDIPANPQGVYGSKFNGVGDWLGTGAVANQHRQYKPFEEAQEFVRELDLKGLAEWQAYCQSGDKPDDIPSNPNRVYSSKFKGYGDWLGTGTTRPSLSHPSVGLHRPTRRTTTSTYASSLRRCVATLGFWPAWCSPTVPGGSLPP